ncbi:MAG TPA: hypothetical protein VGO23_04340 [Pseudonocardia sp.]|jgi:hypothetical protein|nr:hypothetical protein [Pseudonocardia sp.]
MNTEKRNPGLGPAGDVMAKNLSCCELKAQQHVASLVRAFLVMALLVSALLVSAPTAWAATDLVGAMSSGGVHGAAQSACDTPIWVPKPPGCPP